MRRIIYLSAANNRYARDECEAIIAHAQKANARIGVTGMLIFIDGSFFQVLEGETATVLALFEKIAPRYLARPGGYLRVLHTGLVNKGDAAPRSILGFVEADEA